MAQKAAWLNGAARVIAIDPLNYRLEKLDNGWKIYDVNVMGAWLSETYRTTFASEISKGGVDGLIHTLEEKNRQLASRDAQEDGLRPVGIGEKVLVSVASVAMKSFMLGGLVPR